MYALQSQGISYIKNTAGKAVAGVVAVLAGTGLWYCRMESAARFEERMREGYYPPDTDAEIIIFNRLLAREKPSLLECISGYYSTAKENLGIE